MNIFARQALTPDGWVRDLRVTIREGLIERLEVNARATGADTQVDTVLPALGNLHSHSFQRAMAGMTERRIAGQDNFWSWRTLMYQFVDRLTPEQVEAIAALTFMEMQEAGYASVGEFHYLHHQPGGTPYDTPAELSQRIMVAAQTTGIGLTHLPVLYSYGGAGKAPLSDGQLRFGNDVDQFATLVEQVRAAAKCLPDDTRVGIAPHSLRATSPDDLSRALAAQNDGPIHIHIAEQTREVGEITTWLCARPVEWLLDNAPVGPDWCLIHATHMTEAEALRMARSGAVAGLCPITEANLGDGIFSGDTYLKAGGAFGVGSDSNIRISLTEELRSLEYSQRQRDRARNVLVDGAGSVGDSLYLGAAQGSSQALGRKAGCIKKGALADLVAIDSKDPALCALRPEHLLDGLVFAASDSVVTDLWSAGRHQVQKSRHVAREGIVAAYRKAVSDLIGSL